MENKTDKKKKNKIDKRTPLRNKTFIFEFFIIINLFLQIISPFITSKNSIITLKIQGKGQKTIFGSFFESYPNEIKINGDSKYPGQTSYNFELEDNTVELIWDNNNPLYTCKNMFNGCRDITEIDLSYFDTSQVIDMHKMFYTCTSLNSLKLDNFDTSKVTDMSYMFASCSSLSTLNLSEFDTSQVEDMCYMFFSCSSLLSLNLSNFNTLKL